MRYSRFVVSSLFTLACVSACQRAQVDRSLEIRGVIDSVLEAGQPIRIEIGSPVDAKEGLASFAGTAFAPGQKPYQVSWDVPVRPVVASNRIATAETIDWGKSERLTACGVLTVNLADGKHRVQGSLSSVCFDIVEGTGSSLDQELARDEGTTSLLKRIGAQVSTDDDGVVVGSVDPRGRAARSGLRTGDRLLSANQVHVLSVGDLALAPSDSVLRLTVRTASGDRDLTIDVGHDAQRTDLSFAGTPFDVVSLALGLLVGLFMILGPFGRRVSDWMTTKAPESIESPYPLKSILRKSGLWFAAVIVAQLAGADVGHLTGILLVASILWSAIDRDTDPRTSMTKWIMQALALGTAIACPLLMSGSAQVATLVRMQGGAPWQWALFAHPSTLIAGLVLLLVLASPAHNESLLARVQLGLRAGVFSFLFLGGWNVPFDTSNNVGMVLGALLVACKVGLTLIACAWAGQQALVSSVRAWWKVPLFGLGAVALTFSPAELVPSTFGSGVVGLVLTLGVATLIQRWSRRLPTQSLLVNAPPVNSSSSAPTS